MKRLVMVFILISSFLVPLSVTSAVADRANPPVINSIRMLNPGTVYKVGDVVKVVINYSGGAPGIKQVDLWAYNEIAGRYYEDCLLGSSWFADWNGSPSNYGLPIGPVSSTEILMYQYVSNNCVQGVNFALFVARIKDLTDLETRQFVESQKTSFVVSNGFYVPPGEVLGAPVTSKFNLEAVPTEVVLEASGVTSIQLPSNTPEGILVGYNSYPQDVCTFPVRWYQPNTGIIELEIKKTGICNISASINLARSNIRDLTISKEIKVVSRAQFDLEAKKIADAKAAAETAAAEKAAADAKATADANRKEQIINVSPLPNKTVPFSSNGIPLKVTSTAMLSVFAYNNTNSVCEFSNGLIRTKTSGRCVIAFSQEGNSDFKPANNVILDFTIASAKGKKSAITCVKGKLIKKVTSVNPKCPAGYKKR